MDIRLTRKKLQVLFGNLNATDYRKASMDIHAFTAYITEEESIAQTLRNLPKNEIDTEVWVKEANNKLEFELPGNEAERISFCIDLFKSNQKDPLSVARTFRPNSSKYNDQIHEYIDIIAKPIYQYIDHELHKRELEQTQISTTTITAENVLMVQGHNYGSISQTNTSTIQKLSEVASIISNAPDIDITTKRDAIANIDTVKSQLSLTSPNWQIVKIAWLAAEGAATLAGAVELVQMLSKILVRL